MITFATVLIGCFSYITGCFGVVLFICGYRRTVFSNEIRNVSEFEFLSKLIMNAGILLMVTAAAQLISIMVRCQRMMFILTIYLTAMFVMQLIMLGILYTSFEPYYSLVEKSINRWTKNYYTEYQSKLVMDKMQTTLACCGTRGPKDYRDFNRPVSCCSEYKAVNQCSVYLSYKTGCARAVLMLTSNLLKTNCPYILLFGTLQVLCIFFIYYEWMTLRNNCTDVFP